MLIVVVEQNLDFAAALAHRAHVMDMGKILHTLCKDDLHPDRIARDLMVAG